MTQVRVVLSGSGALYPLHAGALGCLVGAGHEIIGWSGTSGGALVAALGAYGWCPLRTMLPLLQKELPREYLRPAPLGSAGALSTHAMAQRLAELCAPTLGEALWPLRVHTTDLDAKRGRVWSRAEDPDAPLGDVVCASMAIPGVFAPVELHGALHVDGGVVANFPLDVWADKPDGTRTLGIRVLDERAPRRPRTLVDVLWSSIGMALDATSAEHMDDAPGALVCELRSGEGMMDMAMGAEQVARLWGEGWRQMEQWLERQEEL